MTDVFLGDSITRAHKSSRIQDLGQGYVQLVYNLLADQSLQLHFINQGHNGAKLVDLLFYLDQDLGQVVADQPVRRIFLMAGVNELWQALDYSDEAWRQYLRKFAGQARQYLTSIRQTSPESELWLLLPVANFSGRGQDRLRDLQATWQGLAEELAVNYLNLQDLLSPGDFLPDQVHLKVSGHEQIAQAVVAQAFRFDQ
ncbi:hypothetical protein AWM75_04955 [Aerococcus urinaehominis]|uniref:Uncharacterized protein n=1 Tax=Aerococcus urinaehominis TaxID=128944 RepID=A0A0X8FLP1_9LACT|nr:GDSL-type esterase/lipase family protein [Aerococcus urinaehominis]AMB99379.1 hypothetical protein AWM75_04955 [Aerococcus urinaehominis]SDM23078.1 Lysophospholipase L1 [Aerococcus urinaehominis]